MSIHATDTTPATQTTLVIGASGKTGRRVTDGVQQALGRPPRDFADYARDTAAAGVWHLERKAS